VEGKEKGKGRGGEEEGRGGGNGGKERGGGFAGPVKLLPTRLKKIEKKL